MIKTLLALTGFVVLGSLLAQPAFSQADACDRAINHITTTLQENGSIDIELKVSDNTENAPSGRPVTLMVGMGSRTSSREQGQRIINILNSPQLLISLTRNIVNNCNRVSAVEYALRYSDYIRTFGLVDGEIKVFECINSRRGNPVNPRWGQQICL